MEIRTKLWLNTAVTVIVAAAIGFVLIMLDREATRLRNRTDDIQIVAQAMLGLNNLTLDYLLHPGQRDLAQWNMTQESVKKALSTIAVESGEEHAIMKELTSDSESIRALFAHMVTLDESASQSQGRQILSGQLLLKIQAMISGAAQLEHLGDQSRLEARRISSIAIIGLVSGLAAMLAVTGYRLARGITRPLQQLIEGVGKIGAGDLSYRIGLNTKDEIGELAQHFDRMTGNLAQGQARRNEAEAELRKASLYARNLIEASLDPLVTISPEGKVTDVNKATEEATGLPREKLIGTYFADYFTEADKARAGYEHVLHEGSVRDYPLTLRHVSGSTMDVIYNATIYEDEHGELQGVFAAARDITERKRAEDAVRRSEAALKEAQRVARVGSWELEADREKIIWSEEIHRIFGLDLTQPPQSFDEQRRLLSPESFAAWDKAITHSRQTGEPYELELEVIRPDGERKWITARGEAVLDARGEVTKFHGTVLDITERKRAEDEVRRLNAELERRVIERTAQLQEANKELEAFAYSVSHDLRTPLRAIDGFSRILLEDYSKTLDDEAQRLLNVVRGNTQRMAQLIDDILQLSRTSRKEMALADIDMMQLAREIVEELTPSVEGREVRIDIQMLPAVRGDRALLHQVFSNLIANAIKFTRTRPAAVIEVSGRVERGEHVYAVKDNGVGFDMQYIDKLFGVFQRLHTLDEFEGTGIGLAIVKRIVTRHGGRVWAESKLNEGAAFYFALPAQEISHA